MNVNDFKPVPSCQITGLEYILAGVLGLRRKGRFVDVGAFDGRTYSNTFQLAEIGWEGICVEPVGSLFNDCVKAHENHRDVMVVREFLTDKLSAHPVMMYECSGSFSGDPDFVKLMNGHPMEQVHVSTLDNVLEDAGWEYFDLLSLDVEGHEMQVLEGFHMRKYEPKIIIAETHPYHERREFREKGQRVEGYLKKFGYKRIYADTINSIFFQKDAYVYED